MRIKSVHLTNYKRFTNFVINDIPESARLVVLIGPNGTGKSSLFDAFLLKSQQGVMGSYSLDGQRRDYYIKHGELSEVPTTTDQLRNNIGIEFHSDDPSRDDWPTVFNMRTAYRNEADFQLTSLERPSTRVQRFERMIDSDQSVSENYKRLAWKAIADVYGDAPGETTLAEYRKETLGELHKVIRSLFSDPPLELQDFGGMKEFGVFRFAKGAATGLPLQKPVRGRE